MLHHYPIPAQFKMPKFHKNYHLEPSNQNVFLSKAIEPHLEENYGYWLIQFFILLNLLQHYPIMFN